MKPWAVMMIALGLTSGAALFAGCGGDEVVGPGSKAAATGAPKPAPAPAAAPQAAVDGGVEGGAADAGLPPLPRREVQERDFIESDQNRDPFRGYAAELLKQVKTHASLQRKVLVDRFALEELKLVGIVTRGQPRALFIDPSGLGWVAKVGDFMGKPELVHSGGPSGTEIAINWRIDRIRDGDVVFIREDPSHPEIPVATRVVALRPEELINKGRTN